MTETLSDIRIVAENQVLTFVDRDTPAGHFLATAQILGLPTSFLLRGKKDDPNAPIIGRITAVTSERQFIFATYSKGGVTGGTYIDYPGSFKEAFKKMIELY